MMGSERSKGTTQGVPLHYWNTWNMRWQIQVYPREESRASASDTGNRSSGDYYPLLFRHFDLHVKVLEAE